MDSSADPLIFQAFSAFLTKPGNVPAAGNETELCLYTVSIIFMLKILIRLFVDLLYVGTHQYISV